jgi:hypothetical protein
MSHNELRRLTADQPASFEIVDSGAGVVGARVNG